ncbi:MAG: citrate synthase family protein [Candidatus Kapaibacterium sp.]
MNEQQNNQRYLTAREAARELGVTAATLYSYVSRGLIHSETTAGTKRDRRYLAEDVERLKRRKEVRHDPSTAARGALHWGTPLLESSITLIDDGKFFYRGYDAVELASARSVEEVAGLIWRGDFEPVRFAGAFPRRWSGMRKSLEGLAPLDQFQLLLPVVAADDRAAYDLRAKGVRATGARMLGMMAKIASGNNGVSDGIAASLSPRSRSGAHARLVTAALILAADHELNISAFSVRCVASAGSTPYAAVAAGLAALGGTKHGGYTERVEGLLRETGKPERSADVIASRLRRGETIPGFHHPLYPNGDPRGRALLDMTAAAFPKSPAVRLSAGISAAMHELTGDHPTIDMGLVTLANALGLPDGSALTLFALGRTIGWIGHAMEQYEMDRLIRPRALYTGRRPEDHSDGNSTDPESSNRSQDVPHPSARR